MSDLDQQIEKWTQEMRKQGHAPILNDDGRLEFFASSEGIHNGPGCSTCGWTTCWHCNHKMNIPQCTSKETQ